MSPPVYTQSSRRRGLLVGKAVCAPRLISEEHGSLRGLGFTQDYELTPPHGGHTSG